MELEQVCRFRFRQGGYGIVAKSDGITPSIEKDVESLFNDTMNPLFTNRRELFECAFGEENVFFAKIQMRSSLGRRTLFTHAYVMKKEDYKASMREDPSVLLSLVSSNMMSDVIENSALEKISLLIPNGSAVAWNELRDKYNLNGKNFLSLVLSAYLILSGRGRLCFRTNRPVEEHEQMIRELLYCVAVACPPEMRGNISFSSGENKDRKFFIVSRDSNVPGSDIIYYDIEKPDINICSQSPALLSDLCTEIVKMESFQDVKDYFELMESEWTSPILNHQNASLAYYCYLGFKDREKKDIKYLLFCLHDFYQNSKNNTFKQVNGILNFLLEKTALDYHDIQNLSKLYFKTGNDDILNCLVQNHSLPFQLCVEVITQIDQDDGMKERQNKLINVILSDFQGEGQLEEEIEKIKKEDEIEAVFFWILQNWENKEDFCPIIQCVYSVFTQIRHLIKKEVLDILDGKYAELPDKLKRILNEYFRDILFEEDREYAEKCLEKWDESNDSRYQDIWKISSSLDSLHSFLENQISEKYFNLLKTYEDIQKVCEEFEIQSGTFEEKVCRFFVEIYDRELNIVRDGKFADRLDVLTSFWDAVEKTRISEDSKKNIRVRATAKFWEIFNYKEVVETMGEFYDRNKVATFIKYGGRDADEFSCSIKGLCYSKKPDTECRKLYSMLFSDRSPIKLKDRRGIIDSIGELAIKLAEDEGKILMELFLLSSCDKNGKVNLHHAIEKMVSLYNLDKKVHWIDDGILSAPGIRRDFEHILRRKYGDAYLCHALENKNFFTQKAKSNFPFTSSYEPKHIEKKNSKNQPTQEKNRSLNEGNSDDYLPDEAIWNQSGHAKHGIYDYTKEKGWPT